MRPLRLTVEGFTSFRERQEIDFRELDLFVITGATGSGKTSILDAVTLALYGMVPRAGKRDLKELISLGASQVQVRLDFRVGDAEYRVARRIPRRGAQSATLERIEGETAVPEVERGGVTAVNERVVEILRLDYPSFTTAVLLPQGDFASFLKGDVGERRKILIRLLDLDRFLRAGMLARERAGQLRTAVEAREEVLAEEYGDATPEALEEARTRASAASKAAEAVEAAHDEARRVLSQREKIGARRDEIRHVTTELETQEAELDAMAATLAGEGARDEETRTALEAAERARAEAVEARERARTAWRETVEETGDEGDLARLAAAAEALAEAEREIERRAAELERNAAELETARAGAERLEAERSGAEAAETGAVGALEAAAGTRREAEAALGVARRARELDVEHGARAAEAAGLREEVAAAEASRVETARVRDEREGALRAAETAHRAAGLRAGLGPGDECPVCGAAVAELPATDPEIAAVLAAHESAAREAAEAALGAETRLSSLRAKLEEVEAAADALDGKRRALGDAPVPAAAEDALTEAAAAEREAGDRLNEAKDRARAAQTEVAEAKAAVAALDATRAAARKARDAAWQRVETTSEGLIAGLGDPLPEPVEEVIETLRARLREATAARDGAGAAWEAAEASHRTASSARKAVEDDLAALDRQRGAQRTLLGARGERLGRLGVEAPAARGPVDAGDRVADTAVLRAHAATLRSAAGRAAGRLKSELAAIDRALRDHAAAVGIEATGSDAATLDATAAATAIEAAARAARRTADRRAADRDQLADRLRRKAEMEADVEKKRDRMRAYAKVANELRTNRFIGFLLDESIEDLAARASHELKKISAGQYSLTSSQNNFEVVDHANADEHRSVVTLSGGETFLASLALALALAGGIADIAGHSAGARLDAMFIDEGFGTLDPESLDQAVEALERLRDGRRMVGIITHVPTLADRIPDGLAVTRRNGHTNVKTRK